MAYKLTVDGDQLMEFLDKWDGKLFENLKEDDIITRVEVDYAGDVTFIIGQED